MFTFKKRLISLVLLLSLLIPLGLTVSAAETAVPENQSSAYNNDIYTGINLVSTICFKRDATNHKYFTIAYGKCVYHHTSGTTPPTTAPVYVINKLYINNTLRFTSYSDPFVLNYDCSESSMSSMASSSSLFPISVSSYKLVSTIYTYDLSAHLTTNSPHPASSETALYSITIENTNNY